MRIEISDKCVNDLCLDYYTPEWTSFRPVLGVVSAPVVSDDQFEIRNPTLQFPQRDLIDKIARVSAGVRWNSRMADFYAPALQKMLRIVEESQEIPYAWIVMGSIPSNFHALEYLHNVNRLNGITISRLVNIHNAKTILDYFELYL